MKTRIKDFCVVLCLIILPSFSVFSEESRVEDPAANTESAKQRISQGQPSPQAAPPRPISSQPEQPVRDVFQSGITPAETQVAPSGQPVEIQTNLEGLSIGARGSRVVINGEVYKEGEDKMGIKILQIRKKEVDILINQSIKRTLSMIPGETRDMPVLPEEASPPATEEGEKADTSITEEQTQNKEPAYA